MREKSKSFENFDLLFQLIKQENNILMTHFSSNNMCVSLVLPEDENFTFYKNLYEELFCSNSSEDIENIIMTNYKIELNI